MTQIGSETWFEEIVREQSVNLKPVNPHILVAGTSGSGKSNCSEFLIYSLALEDGKTKAVEIGDEDDWESIGYLFPIDNNFFVKRHNTLMGTDRQASSMNVEIISIVGTGLETYDQIPNKIKLRSINPAEVMLGDLEQMYQDKGIQAALGYLLYDHGDMNIIRLLDFLKSGEGDIHPQTRSSIIRKISQAFSSGIFSEEYEHVDFKKIVQDKSVFTVFNTAFLETQNQKSLAISLIIKNVFETQRLVKTPLLLYYRECAEVFQKYSSEEYSLAQRYLENIARKGRRIEFRLILDTQRRKDIPLSIRANMGTKFYFKLTYEDAKNLIEEEGVRPDIIKKIPQQNPGEAIIICGADWKRPSFLPPTLHLHKRAGIDLFELLGKDSGYTKVNITSIKTNSTHEELKKNTVVEEKKELKPEGPSVSQPAPANDAFDDFMSSL